ncbi:hypothetical protein [Afipia sp. DC4300-2b1]|uniref:hypothetical protein n=1 Tax=Afipia sp. DC4300-2b1 TaxID=2804672 RepID=UPI003CF4641A
MAGSISLSLSQQFDQLGRPLANGLLYFIQAGTTSTPQNAYYDTALTLPLPNPVTLSASGRIPAFYLADGQIKVRLTDKYGVAQFEQDNLLVVGPSSGGGGGAGVDPTTVFQTGDCLWLPAQGTRSGWVRANGRTIGSSTSGASERANADVSSLYVYLWTNYSNTVCPVSTGRGASAAADFAANKTITLLDMRGYVPGGLDDMGNSAASRYANVPVVSGDTITAASVLGEATHALITAELAAHSHANTLTDPGHTHTTATGSAVLTQAGSTVNLPYILAASTTGSSTTGITITNASTGSGTAHNNVQKTILGSFYLKL